ncbi:MAG: type II restriction endonuclease [Kiritimatiellae bacterium]|nr:type II restriction endonuclease [Kiritimatiellia bacterium]
MAHKQQLSELHQNTTLNDVSKRQESALTRAVDRVYMTLRRDNPQLDFHKTQQWNLAVVIARLRELFPQVPFCECMNTSTMRPDGGILSIRGKDGNLFPILISEKKNQGTNDLRELQGKPKQAKGNAIERLGKNVIGLRAAMLNESIFPFVCFGDGCDFADDSSIVDRVKTIAMFGTLNEVHLHNEGPDGIFNRGTYFFRVQEWTEDEMYTRSVDIARRSIFYYFSKYGESRFSTGNLF